eukprot:284682-Ditylum_brightwellii.AAC.1
MVEYHHNTVCNSTLDGGSAAKTGNNGSSKQAEAPATFVEEFMRANKGKRRKLVAELTIGGRGGQLHDESRDEWNFFGGRDDFVQTSREANEAHDPA